MVTVLVPLAQGMEEPETVSVIDLQQLGARVERGNVARLKPG